MKFLYCPQCKRLRVKPWFSFRNRCEGCMGEARVIDIPNSWMTYTSYILYVVIPVLVVFYVTQKTQIWIYAAVVLLVVMMILTYMDILRGEKFAKAKIKVTASDADRFRTRGWK